MSAAVEQVALCPDGEPPKARRQRLGEGSEKMAAKVAGSNAQPLFIELLCPACVQAAR